jgi:tRNA1(Val) A37 N6-methylase TrmN6
LTLSGYSGDEDGLQKIILRQILIKNIPHLSFTYRYKTRDIVKNHNIENACLKIEGYLLSHFSSAVLCHIEYDLLYPSMKKTKPSLKKNDNLGHDRLKHRILETSGKQYLQDLKITDKSGQVIKSAQDKFRQIDKYLEILSGLIKSLDTQKIKKIADMGSGKGYLTFSLCDYLVTKIGISPQIIGVEHRRDMVDLCNKIAEKSKFKNLSFVQGSIQDFHDNDINILIALHACDTATDDAIEKGVLGNADLIVVAPCCHKQVRKSMNDLNHQSILRHGIFKERMAEIITDSLRALILEYHGYEVKVFEFISHEHTAKNIMIVATKTNTNPIKQKDILASISKLKSEFGITHHYLEKII